MIPPWVTLVFEAASTLVLRLLGSPRAPAAIVPPREPVTVPPPPEPEGEANRAAAQRELARRRATDAAEVYEVDQNATAPAPSSTAAPISAAGSHPAVDELEPVTLPVVHRDTKPANVVPVVDRFVQARSYAAGRPVAPYFVALHTTQNHLRRGIARDVAATFATTSKVSAGYVVDADETIQCVREEDTAFAAKSPANEGGIHVELCGWAEWTSADWAKPDAVRMLERGARLVADICERNAFPLEFVEAEELRDGGSGITTHAVCSEAWHRTTHWDPGPGFPLAGFIEQVRAFTSPA